MDVSALWSSHWLIVIHAFTAMGAVVIGAIQLLLQKGTANHRLLGYAWVSLIVVVSLTSFGIFELRMFGPVSVIHLLPIVTIFTAVRAIIAIRADNVELHKRLMVVLYTFALLLTGAFTLYPGRLMNQVLLG